MFQSNKSTRSAQFTNFEADAPLELYCGLLALNAGIWVSNFWGWLWTGLISLVVTACTLFLFARMQKTIFAS